MYTETDFILCTGLQLQPAVNYVNVDCTVSIQYLRHTHSVSFEPLSPQIALSVSRSPKIWKSCFRTRLLQAQNVYHLS